MPETYPYTISNNKFENYFDKIRKAARPDRLSRQVLKHWGFTGSNDRALIPILKGLGFLDENGVPTELYSQLQGDTNWKTLLGEQIKELYRDLYATNTNLHNASDDEIKGAFSRITGKDASSVNRYFGTFRALANLAKFDGKPKTEKQTVTQESEREKEKEKEKEDARPGAPQLPNGKRSDLSFHYNIQIHLPATNDVSVYNAIFKSLKEHLDI